MKNGISFSILAAFVLILSCGDSTGPSGADVSPSTLSVEYTGDPFKAGEDNSPGAPSQTALSIANSLEIGTGPKGSCVVTASWTICGDAAFKSYILYRSESPEIPSDPSSAEVLGVFNDVNTSEYIYSNIDWAIMYYYALKTNDTNDNGVWSTEVSVDIPVALPDSVITVVGVKNL